MNSKGEDNDAALFAASIGDTRPLQLEAKVSSKRVVRKPPPPHPQHAPYPSTTTNGGTTPLHQPSPWTLVSPGISRERLRKLGQSRADLLIDLHGMNRDQAVAQLQLALTSLVARGGRMVEIIHGRGLHSQGKAILRQALYDWLRSEQIHGLVLAAIAKPNSGGGACLVLLRRRR
ncbi:MAG: Smr/MutS family protein [Mariprofundales bacterium]